MTERLLKMALLWKTEIAGSLHFLQFLRELHGNTPKEKHTRRCRSERAAARWHMILKRKVYAYSG